MLIMHRVAADALFADGPLSLTCPFITPVAGCLLARTQLLQSRRRADKTPGQTP